MHLHLSCAELAGIMHLHLFCAEPAGLPCRPVSGSPVTLASMLFMTNTCKLCSKDSTCKPSSEMPLQRSPTVSECLQQHHAWQCILACVCCIDNHWLQQLYSAKEMDEGKIPEDGKAAHSRDDDASSRQKTFDSSLNTDAPAKQSDTGIVNAIMKQDPKPHSEACHGSDAPQLIIPNSVCVRCLASTGTCPASFDKAVTRVNCAMYKCTAKQLKTAHLQLDMSRKVSPGTACSSCFKP